MVRVEILKTLVVEIKKRFSRTEAQKVIDLIETVEKQPKKGKLLSRIGGIAIKELKYKAFRFYFLVDEYKLKFLSEEELIDLLLRFVRMSDKKHQQETINEIKKVLQIIGPKGFE